MYKIQTIKPFFYNNHFFVYDMCKNQLLNVSKNQYKEVLDLRKKGLKEYITQNKDQNEYSAILTLISKGYFKCSPICNIKHPAYDYIEDLLNQCVSEMTLQVTQNCNFNCRYCGFTINNNIGRNHQVTEMTWATAKNGIDFLYDHCSNTLEVCLSFYGGEPLLNFGLIKKCVEYCKTKFSYKKITYRMTTNFSVLTPEIADFLVANDFHLAISLDGNESIQNKHRRFASDGHETFSIVMENVNFLRNRYTNYFRDFVIFMPVTFLDENIEDVYHFFEDIHVPKKSVSKLEVDLNGIDYMHNMLQLKETERCHTMDQESEKDAIFDEIYSDKSEIPKEWHHNGPCIPGVKRLFVSVDGNFYTCEKVPEYEKLSIGSIQKGFNIERIKKFLNVGLISAEKCQQCWAARYCNICYAQCIDLDSLDVSKSAKPCKYQKELLLSFLKRKIEHALNNSKMNGETK